MDASKQVIKGQDIQDGDAAYLLVKSLLRGDALQAFKNKEASQDVKDSLNFTKCLIAVTEQVGIPRVDFANDQVERLSGVFPSTGQSDCREDYPRGIC
eukprot:6408228-Ditylum_brightwellii.AAC.1